MPTSGRDNIIGKLKREAVANVASDAVIGKVKHWKDLRFPEKSGVESDHDVTHSPSFNS
jgi:hypothetical protein